MNSDQDQEERGERVSARNMSITITSYVDADAEIVQQIAWSDPAAVSIEQATILCAWAEHALQDGPFPMMCSFAASAIATEDAPIRTILSAHYTEHGVWDYRMTLEPGNAPPHIVIGQLAHLRLHINRVETGSLMMQALHQFNAVMTRAAQDRMATEAAIRGIQTGRGAGQPGLVRASR